MVETSLQQAYFICPTSFPAKGGRQTAIVTHLLYLISFFNKLFSQEGLLLGIVTHIMDSYTPVVISPVSWKSNPKYPPYIVPLIHNACC
jgi:hypothetical protein